MVRWCNTRYGDEGMSFYIQQGTISCLKWKPDSLAKIWCNHQDETNVQTDVHEVPSQKFRRCQKYVLWHSQTVEPPPLRSTADIRYQLTQHARTIKFNSPFSAAQSHFLSANFMLQLLQWWCMQHALPKDRCFRPVWASGADGPASPPRGQQMFFRMMLKQSEVMFFLT